MYQDFIKKMGEMLPADRLLTSPDDCSAYGSDWTKLPGKPGPVCLPRSTDEVVAILRLCREFRLSVVPSGGRTGLAGGAVAARGEVVLSLSKMNRIAEVDTLGLSLRVQAGAVTQAVHEHCAAVGLTWPIDLASKGTSQIGGNLSTNAGGVRVIRYGMARKWVIGLQAVTMQGEVLELNGDLEKNNTGYDLVQLLVGSEGTLAVITEATLKLTRLPQNTSVLFFALASLPAMGELFSRARRGPFDILAFEFFSEWCLKAVETKLGRRARFESSHPYYVLLEIESKGDTEAVDAWLGEVVEQNVVADGMIGHSSEEQKAIWTLREGITESLQMTAPLRKYDMSVATRKVLPFLSEVEALFEEERFKIDLYLFGHLGDGSPHLNLLKPADASLVEFNADCERLEKTLFPLLKSYGGSVSAEHGVGILKKHWLTYSRTKEELGLYRAIKKAFDPSGLLNPGKVID